MTDLTPEQEREVTEFTVKQFPIMTTRGMPMDKMIAGAIESAGKHGVRSSDKFIAATLMASDPIDMARRLSVCAVSCVVLAKLATMGIREERS